MAYKLQARESVQSGIHRVMIECLSDARAHLAAEGEQQHQGIHEARKRIKEIRALLRLVRQPLGREFARENAFYRDTAAALSEFRDAEAMIEAFNQFAASSRQPQNKLNIIREQLERRRDTQVATPQRIATAMREASLRLAEAEPRIAHWQIGNQFSALSPGLQRSYRQGRKRLKRARKDPADEALHEWRKRVKDYWYQSKLLRDLWPAVMSAWQKQLKVLSGLLGDEHDLTVLITLFEEHADDFGGKTELKPVLTELAKHQQKLRKRAWLLGARLYTESPEAHISRLYGWWKIWRR